MANTKNYAAREKIIDRLLQKPGGATRKEIMAACNRELRARGWEEIRSRGTILEDIATIEAYVGAEIFREKVGRQVYYSYRNPDFSIYHYDLSVTELEAMRLAVDALGRLASAPGNEWMGSLQARLKTSFFRPETAVPLLGFEAADDYTGDGHVGTLLDCIEARQPIDIDYRRFGCTTRTHTVHPYFLWRASNRWYLFARIDGHLFSTPFCLDRIEEVRTTTRVRYVPKNDSEDFTKMLANVIGVGYYENEPEEIVCRVREEEIPYLESCRLHRSQYITKPDNGWAYLFLFVVDNHELRRALLAYAEHLQVLAPPRLKEEMEEIHARQLEWGKEWRESGRQLPSREDTPAEVV